jgi:hypothetical protein
MFHASFEAFDSIRDDSADFLISFSMSCRQINEKLRSLVLHLPNDSSAWTKAFLLIFWTFNPF